MRAPTWKFATITSMMAPLAYPARAGGEGINVKNGSSNISIHHNLVNNLDKLGFGVDAWTGVTRDIHFSSNVAHDTYYGFIVSSEQGGSVENVSLDNNIAYHTGGAGFAIVWWGGTVDGPKRDVQFINNTSFGNQTGLSIQSPRNEAVVVRNNIFSQNSMPVSIVSGALSQVTLDSNLFDGGATSGTRAIAGNPLFVNPNVADFRLQNGSPAVDAGSGLNAPGADFDGAPRPRGAGYDIGAYER